MMKIHTSYFKNLFYILLFLNLIHFSCKKNDNWVDYNKVEIVRSSRDSTFYLKGKLYDGEIKKINKKGDVIFNFNVKNGRLNGHYSELFDNGNLKISSNYLEGKLNGKFISYYKNKKINEETFYINGLINGSRKLYWSNGSLKESSKLKLGVITGECLFYYSNSNMRKKILFDQYGNRDGIWKDYYPNGKVKSEIEYKSGDIISPARKYDLNGKLLN